MKIIFSLIVILFILSVSLIHSQDTSWLVDVSHEVGLDSTLGTRILLVDINNDNYPDLLWGTGNISKNHYHLYLNVPNPDLNSSTKRIFIDFTDSSNINANRNPEKQDRIVDIAALADVNNDGNVDLVTSIYYHRLQMYLDSLDPGDRSEVLLNDGNGHFTLKPDNGLYQYGLINSTGLAFLDYDLDGKIDLYISTWFYDYLNEIKQPDVLFKGIGDGTFIFIQNNGVQSVWEPMYGVNVTDWNNDGWQDVITSGYCRSGGSLYRNDQNGFFSDVAQLAGYTGQKIGGDHNQALCQWEAQPADFDNDGDMDLLQVEVHGGYNPGEGRTHISVNQGLDSSFRYSWELDRIRRNAPIESHLGDQGGQWFDLDNDGWLDIAICQMGYASANLQGQERLYICRQNKDHHFDDMTQNLGFVNMKECHSIEPADYDLDGDQDVFLSRQIRDTTYIDSIIDGQIQKVPVYKIYMRLFLLRNDIGNKNNWTSVKLLQPAGANQSGLGSRITVCSNGINQISEIQAGLGHFSGQQPFIRNVGLGQRNRIDSIIVRWPIKNSPTTVVYNPPLNLILEIDSLGLRNLVKPWEGKKPLITFEEHLLDFDTINIGESKDLTFNVKNIGDKTLNITNILIDDSDSAVYSSANMQSPFTLEPNNIKSFTVRFSPRFRAEYEGVVKFESDAQNAPSKAFDLMGYGFHQEPLIVSNTQELNFPTIWIDSVRTMQFTIQNTGEIPLSVSELKIEKDTSEVFTCTNINKQFVLLPGESEDISVTYSPKDLKDYSSELNVISNAYNQSNLIIQLNGKCDGPAPEIKFSSTSVFFLKTDVSQTREKNFNISNVGNSELNISNVFVENDTAGIFSIPDLSLPISIQPDSTNEIKIVFTPKEAITYRMNLIIQSNSFNNSSDTVSLRGTGSEPTDVAENRIENESFSVSIAPNPITDEALITVSIYDEKNLPVVIFICDLTGRIVLRIPKEVFITGQHKIRIPSSLINTGIYYLIAQRGENRFNKLVTIIK